jgi:hypothetical protein
MVPGTEKSPDSNLDFSFATQPVGLIVLVRWLRDPIRFRE